MMANNVTFYDFRGVKLNFITEQQLSCDTGQHCAVDHKEPVATKQISAGEN